MIRKALLLALFLIIAAAASAQRTPNITVSPLQVVIPGHVGVQGSGFTPKHNVSSHLRKPDGSEYPVIPILTDDHGEFTHDIETLVLQVGTHELWVVDDTSKTSSNPVRFEVMSNF